MRATTWVAVPAGLVLLCAVLRTGPQAGKPTDRRAAAAVEFPPPSPVLSAAPRWVSSRQRDPFLEGDPAVIRAILEQLDRPDVSPAERGALLDGLQKDILRLRVNHGVHVLPLVRRMLTDEALPDDLRKAALEALENYGHPQIADFLARLAVGRDVVAHARPDVLRVLSETMRRLSADMRTRDLKGLCRQALELALASSDPKLRTAAASSSLWHVRIHGNAQTTAERLVEILESDPDPGTRAAAAYTLSVDEDLSKGNVVLAGRLHGLFRKSRDPFQRQQALHALYRTETEIARRLVLESLSDPSEDVRRTAIWGAGRLAMAEAVPTLIAQLADPSTAPPLKQFHLVRALGLMPGWEAAEAVLSSVRAAEDPQFRWDSLEALRESPALNDPRLVPALAATYEAVPDDSAKRQAARLLAKNPAPEAYAALERAYRDSRDDLRVEVASALLHSSHGRAFAQAAFDELFHIGLDRLSLGVLIEADSDRALGQIEAAYVVREGRGLSHEARQETLMALVPLETPASTSLLRRILLVEKDPDLRDEIEEELRRREEP